MFRVIEMRQDKALHDEKGKTFSGAVTLCRLISFAPGGRIGKHSFAVSRLLARFDHYLRGDALPSNASHFAELASTA